MHFPMDACVSDRSERRDRGWEMRNKSENAGESEAKGRAFDVFVFCILIN